MPKTITYDGPSARDDISTEFIIRDENRKPYTLRKGRPIEVPDDLATRLLGDGSPKGHKFSEFVPDKTADAALADLKAEGAADTKTKTKTGSGS